MGRPLVSARMSDMRQQRTQFPRDASAQEIRRLKMAEQGCNFLISNPREQARRAVSQGSSFALPKIPKILLCTVRVASSHRLGSLHGAAVALPAKARSRGRCCCRPSGSSEGSLGPHPQHGRVLSPGWQSQCGTWGCHHPCHTAPGTAGGRVFWADHGGRKTRAHETRSQ